MLSREAALRVDGATQREYGRVEAASGDATWMEVTADLQRAVAREFGYGADLQLAVDALRAAAPRHPDIAFWVRHNRSSRGALRARAAAPDVPLARIFDATETATTLHALVPADRRPLALVALSYS